MLKYNIKCNIKYKVLMHGHVINYTKILLTYKLNVCNVLCNTKCNTLEDYNREEVY